MERECLQSLTTNLTAYYQAMFSDIAWLYRRPSELKKDLSRFSHELGVNGSRFATIDLPALGKHFDRCLDQGLYRLPICLMGGEEGKRRSPYYYGISSYKSLILRGSLGLNPQLTPLWR